MNLPKLERRLEIKTRVIFRIWPREGDVIALFPDLPANYDPYLCESYQHVGQHASADPLYCIRVTKPASYADYNFLQTELEMIGYDLKVIQKYPQDAIDRRREELKRIDLTIPRST
jgi:hypothetical protein